MKELCIRLCFMCTNPLKGSLPSPLKTALLLKGVLRVIWEREALAAPLLLFLPRRSVLGRELFPWLPHVVGHFSLWVSKMRLVYNHSNQYSRFIFPLDCFPSIFCIPFVVIIFMLLRFVSAWKGATKIIYYYYTWLKNIYQLYPSKKFWA